MMVAVWWALKVYLRASMLQSENSGIYGSRWLLVTSTPAIGRQGPETTHLSPAEDPGERETFPRCLGNSAGCFCPAMLFVPGRIAVPGENF